VARPGAKRLEPEGVEEVVDRRQGPGHPELGLPDAADVRPAEDTDLVDRGRAGPDAVGQPGPGVGVERGLAPPAGGVGQPVGAGGVVPGHPGPDLAGREAHLGGDVFGTVAEEGEADGGQPANHLGSGLGPDAGGEVGRGVMGLDVHGDLLTVTTG